MASFVTSVIWPVSNMLSGNKAIWKILLRLELNALDENLLIGTKEAKSIGSAVGVFGVSRVLKVTTISISVATERISQLSQL